MRIIVISDSHGNYTALEKVFERNLSADIFIHLGDGETELDKIIQRYPQLDIRHVSGNCDFASFSPKVIMIGAGDYKILATHGHKYGVKYSIEALMALAKENGANIALFGHSHVRHESYEDGIYFLNPGSVSLPRDGKKASYGFIDITTSGVVTNIVEL